MAPTKWCLKESFERNEEGLVVYLLPQKLLVRLAIICFPMVRPMHMVSFIWLSSYTGWWLTGMSQSCRCYQAKDRLQRYWYSTQFVAWGNRPTSLVCAEVCWLHLFTRVSQVVLGIREMILTLGNLCFVQHLRGQMLLGSHHDFLNSLCTLPSLPESLRRTSPSWIRPLSGIEFLEVSSLGARKAIPCGRYSISHRCPPSISTDRSTRDMLAMVEVF